MGDFTSLQIISQLHLFDPIPRKNESARRFSDFLKLSLNSPVSVFIVVFIGIGIGIGIFTSFLALFLGIETVGVTSTTTICKFRALFRSRIEVILSKSCPTWADNLGETTRIVGTIGTGAIVLLGEARIVTLGVFQYALIPVNFSVRAADRIIDLVASFSASVQLTRSSNVLIWAFLFHTLWATQRKTGEINIGGLAR